MHNIIISIYTIIECKILSGQTIISVYMHTLIHPGAHTDKHDYVNTTLHRRTNAERRGNTGM